MQEAQQRALVPAEDDWENIRRHYPITDEYSLSMLPIWQLYRERDPSLAETGYRR